MRIHVTDQRSGTSHTFEDFQDTTTFEELKRAVREKLNIEGEFVLMLGDNGLYFSGETTLKDCGLVSGDKLFVNHENPPPPQQAPPSVEPPLNRDPASHPRETLPRPEDPLEHRRDPAATPVQPIIPDDSRIRTDPNNPLAVPTRAPGVGHPDAEVYRGIDDPNDPMGGGRGHYAPNYPNPFAGGNQDMGPFGHGPLAPLGQPGGPLGPSAGNRPSPFDPTGGGEFVPNRPQRPEGNPRIMPFRPTDDDPTGGGFGLGGGPSGGRGTGPFGARGPSGGGGNDFI